MTTEELIHAYEVGGEKVHNAIKGLLPVDMLAYPVPGTWSIQEIVIHLQDADAVFAHRVKRILAEDEPTYNAWSENRFVERLAYDQQSPEDAVELIEVTHRQLTRVLRKLPPDAFDRAGTHSERGRQTVKDVLGYAVWHVDHHVRFIVDKREMLGKIMW